MTDISSTTAKPDIPSMISPEDLAKNSLRNAGMVLNHNSPPIIASIAATIRAAVEAEREECAKIAQKEGEKLMKEYVELHVIEPAQVAARIRNAIYARGDE